MTDQPLRLKPTVLNALRENVRGKTILPGDSTYVAARRVWNGAIDRHPAAIVACSDADDVAFAMRIAADHGLQLTVRGGGHNVAGRSIRDGVLLLDLSQLRSVSVNAALKVGMVQGGALWRDVDAATGTVGLATTGGLVSSTGVGGFTLGGGAGWLMRAHGLACDNLRAADVVLPEGRSVRASESEHPDLYWALRGGAGGFGVVTNFEFQLHTVQNVLAGLIVYPVERALDTLRLFRDFAASADDEFCGVAVIAHAPPLPFLDAAWHGRPVVILALCWSGNIALGEKRLAALRGAGQPLADVIGPMPYVQWQQMQDAGAPAGRHQYWKSLNFSTLSEAALEQLAGAAMQLPSLQSEIHVQHMGGAVARMPLDETAFAHRDARFFVNFLGATVSSDGFPIMQDKVRELHAQLSGHATHGTLPNFADADDQDDKQRFGELHAQRLASLRQRLDPHSVLSIS